MQDQEKIMAMLQRNANYNDRTGSTYGAGYIGGYGSDGDKERLSLAASGGMYIGGCSNCGEHCMHCGAGYIGGFANERLLFGKKVYPNKKERQLKIAEYLHQPGREADLAEYNAVIEKRSRNAKSRMYKDVNAEVLEFNPENPLVKFRSNIAAQRELPANKDKTYRQLVELLQGKPMRKSRVAAPKKRAAAPKKKVAKKVNHKNYGKCADSRNPGLKAFCNYAAEYREKHPGVERKKVNDSWKNMSESKKKQYYF